MKKLITFTFLIIGLTGFSQEETTESIQSKKWAVKAGLMMSSVVSEAVWQKRDVIQNEAPISPYVGIRGAFGKKFIFQPELLVSYYKLNIGGGVFNNNSSYNENSTVNYNGDVLKLSVPLLVKFKVANKVSLHTGVTTSLLMINKDKGIVTRTIDGIYSAPVTTTTAINPNISWNPAVTLGMEYELNSKFYLEARFNYSPAFTNGLSEDSNIYDSKDLGIREKNSINVGVGYYIF